MLNVSDVQFDDSPQDAAPPPQKPLKMSDVTFDDEPAPKQPPIKASDVKFEDTAVPTVTVGAPNRPVANAPTDSFDTRKYLPKDKPVAPLTNSFDVRANLPRDKVATSITAQTIDALNNPVPGQEVSNITGQPIKSVAQQTQAAQDFTANQIQRHRQSDIGGPVEKQRMQILAALSPEDKLKTGQQIAKTRPVTENEQQALGISPSYMERFAPGMAASLGDTLAGVAQAAPNALTGNWQGVIAKPDNFVSKGFEQAAQNFREQANLYGKHNLAGDLSEDVGGLVPDIAASTIAPEGKVAQALYWGASQGLKTAARGGTPQDVAESAVMGAALPAILHGTAELPLVQRMATSGGLMSTITLAQRGDINAIGKSFILGSVMGIPGGERSSDDVIAKAADSPDLQRAVFNHYQNPTAENEAALRTAATAAGLTPAEIDTIANQAKPGSASVAKPEATPVAQESTTMPISPIGRDENGLPIRKIAPIPEHPIGEARPGELAGAEQVKTDESLQNPAANVIPVDEQSTRQTAEEPKSASVKAFITKADEAALKARGYSDDDIYKMKPAEAQRILESPASNNQNPHAGKTFIHESDADFDKYDMSKATSNTEDEWFGRGQYLQEKGTFKIEQYGNKRHEYELPANFKALDSSELLPYVESKGLLPQHLKDQLATYKSESELPQGYELLQNERGQYFVFDEKGNQLDYVPSSTRELALKKAYNRIHGLETSLSNITPRDIFKAVGRENLVRELQKDGYDGFYNDGELVAYNPERLTRKVKEPLKAAEVTTPGTTEDVGAARILEHPQEPIKVEDVKFDEQPIGPPDTKIPEGATVRKIESVKPPKAPDIEAPEMRSTGVKNETVDSEREARGAPPIEKLARKSFGKSYDQGRAIVDNDPVAFRRSVAELTTKPRVLSDSESAALVYDRMRLQNEEQSLQRQIAEVQSSGNEEAQIGLQGQLDEVQKHIENNDFAADRVGTHAGRALAIRRMMIREDYSLDNLMRRAKIANDGEPVPPKKAARLKELAETIARTNEEMGKGDEAAAQKAADKAVAKIADEAKTASRRVKRSVSKAKLDNDFDSLKNEFKSLFKSKPEPPSKGLGGPEAGAVVGLTLPAEAAALLTRMAKNRIEAGIVKAVDVVDSIYTDVKDSLPDGISKRDIRDAISGYGKTSQMSKDVIDKALRQVKAELRDVSSEEDIVGGQAPKRSGLQRDPVTPEARARKQRINQLMRENGIKIEGSERSPEQQQKSALDGVKTRLKNAIQDLTRQIQTGEKPQARTPVPKDAEAKALETERDGLRATLDAINGPRKMTDAQRIDMATKSLEKSIAEYDRRIADKDFAAKAKADPVTNLQLEALKQRRDAAKKTYQALKDADPDAIAKKQASQNAALKKRLVKRQGELEEMLRTGNFEKTPKAKLPLTAENIKLQNENRAATREVQQIIKRMNEGIGAKVLRAASDVINAPKSLLTSIDISAGGRQGLVQAFAHPKIAAEAFVKQFQAMSEVGQTRVYDEIQKMPFFGEAKKAGLYFAGDPLQSSGREEAFLSKLPEKIPIIGRAYAGSERAYSAFLDWQRIRAYGVESNLLKKSGLTPEANPKEFQQLAKFINRTTGRGDLGESHTAATASQLLNLPLFSPRFMASRFQMLSGLASKNPQMRRIAGRTLGLYYGGVITALGLAAAAGLKVSTDPDDPDFMKVRAGNTSYDLTRGQNQDMRLAFQLIRGFSNNARSVENTAAQQPGNVILHYLRGKTAPALGTAIDYKMGSNIVGDKFSWSGAALNSVAPMVGRDLYEGYKDSGAPGFVKTLPTVVGVGVQTYKRTPQEIRDVQSLATKFKQANHIPMDTFSGGASELTTLKRSLETSDLPTAESEIKRLLGELRGTKPGIDDRVEARTKIKKAIDEWAGFHAGTEKAEYADAGFRPLFTGSASNESKFRQSLTPAQQQTYNKAVTARKQAWEQFNKLLRDNR